jgi:hypothetical protein
VLSGCNKIGLTKSRYPVILKIFSSSQLTVNMCFLVTSYNSGRFLSVLPNFSYHSTAATQSKVKIKVILRSTVSRSVCPGISPHLGPATNFSFSFMEFVFRQLRFHLIMESPLWQMVRSVALQPENQLSPIIRPVLQLIGAGSTENSSLHYHYCVRNCCDEYLRWSLFRGPLLSNGSCIFAYFAVIA